MLNAPQNLSSDAAEISKYFENCLHSFGCKKLTYMWIFVSFSFILREKFFLLEIQTLNKLAIFSHSALRHFIETTECLRYWSVKLNSRIYANSPSTQEQWSYFQDHGKHQFSTFSSIHLRSGWCFSCLSLPLFLKIYGCCKEQCNFGQSLGL